MQDKIYGLNPVIEALESGAMIDKILLKDGARNNKVKNITAMAKERKIPFQFVDSRRLDTLTDGGNHQGVVAFAAVYKYFSVEDILNKAKEKGEPPFIVICDSLTDPHNLGSIIRTANAAGVHGVIIPKTRSAELNSTVYKVTAGACE